MKKIVIFTGGIETQGFFSLELAKELKALGHPVYNFNLEYEEKSLAGLLRFVEKGNTVMLTFNFHGISGEDIFVKDDGTLFWDEFHIPCVNIVVDHPLYYHHFLEKTPERYTHVNIDRFHRAYMRECFPEIEASVFLPLAGTALAERPEREFEIVFTGNYTPPSRFEQYITRLDDDYTAFYYGMIDDLLAHPSETLESVAKRHILQEIPEATEEEVRSVFPNLTFIDLYIRFYERGKAVRTLVDAGLKVHVWGEGWDMLECEHPENILRHGPADSLQCLQAIAKAKISLNVMPWFKDGAHDRVFNSCGNGALCLSDKSLYLEEVLKDGEEVVYYDLNDMEALPQIAADLLSSNSRREEIAERGREKTLRAHLWKHRADVLHEIIEKGGKNGRFEFG
ncbi:MAG: glycosyltransferase family 1 protein [Lachnospiraceae bacterium]|nr:glycosyltransferase family 1 protein [Lachnospiraceae bacterium]